MAKPDWKDLLSGLKNENETTDNAEGSNSQAASVTENNQLQPSGNSDTGEPFTKQELVVRFEKRNGKPATILSRFQGSEAELKALAAALKKHCGTGGSAKDDEILIQGDVRVKVADYLKRQGHRVKGDFKK